MNQGSSQQNGDAEDVAPKTFMDFDESQKAAILNEMSTVMDMEKILPDDLKEWDKKTTSLVLEKAFDLCGIPRTTEGRSTEEVRTEQINIMIQLDALRKKKAENPALLKKHEEVAEARFCLELWLHIQKTDLGHFIDQMQAPGFDPNHQENQNLEEAISTTRTFVAQYEAELEALESPLRD